MRVHKNKDVEHEALTDKDEGNCSIQVETCPTSSQNHLRCCPGLNKRTIIIIFFTLFSIVFICMFVMLALLLQNNNVAELKHNGVKHQKSNEKDNQIRLEIVTEHTENKVVLDKNTNNDLGSPMSKLNLGELRGIKITHFMHTFTMV